MAKNDEESLGYLLLGGLLGGIIIGAATSASKSKTNTTKVVDRQKYLDFLKYENEFTNFKNWKDGVEQRFNKLKPLPEKRQLIRDKIALRGIQEAINLYSLGYFRWSIIACISTLEYLLKKKLTEDSFNKLIEKAHDTNLISTSDYHFLHGLRNDRNDTIHEIEKVITEDDSRLAVLITLRVLKSIIPALIENKYNFSLFKQENDDHYWNKLLDLNHFRYIINLIPRGQFNYWRFGIKFSKTEDINTDKRESPNQPIFHFIKNIDQTNLMTRCIGNFINSTNSQPKLLFSNYNNAQVIFTITKTDDQKVVLTLSGKTTSNIRNIATLHDFSYAKIFAWGDGNPFELYVTVQENEKI